MIYGRSFFPSRRAARPRPGAARGAAAARAPGATARRRSTWSAARSATCCSAARPSTSIWWSRATRPALAARWAASSGCTTASGPRPSALDGFAYDIARARRETYAHPGALPDVEPAPLGRGPAPARLHRQRDRDGARRAEPPGELRAAPSALEDLDAEPAARPARPRASSTTRPGCCGWPATPAGWASRSSRTPASWRARRSTAGALDTVSGTAHRAPSCGCWPASDDPVGALAGAARAGARPRPAPALRAATTRSWPGARWRCCRPTGGRDRLVLAAAARGRARRRSSPGCSTGWRSRPRTATRSWPRPRGPGARATRWRAPSAPVGDRRRGGRRAARAGGAGRRARRRGAPAPAMARAPAPRPSSRSTATTCSPPACPRARPIGRGLRAALAAKLDGRASGREQELAEALERRRATAVAWPAMRADACQSRSTRRASTSRIDLPGRPGAVHHPPRRVLRGPLREPEPGPADRRRARGGPAQPGQAARPSSGCRSRFVRQVHGTRGAADRRAVRRRASHRSRTRASSCPRPTARRRALRGRGADGADRRLPADRDRRRTARWRCCTPAGAGWPAGVIAEGVRAAARARRPTGR